ncbi:MAG: carboxypeptidase-like regulatory domain-containing protein [Bdellovibrionota bacterium]
MMNLRSIFLLLMCLSPVHLHAAGYLEYNESTKVPYAWDTGSAITCNRDQGTLGSLLESAVDTRIDNALSAWANATTSSPMSFSACSDVSTNITDANYTSFVDLTGATCPQSDFLVVYDQDGAIFQELFGSVVSDTSGILGFASPTRFSGNAITCGVIFLNGENTALTLDLVASVSTHEFGHMLNFTHTQIHEDQFQTATNATDSQYIPTMYFAVSPTGTEDSLASLELDDQFAFMGLYDSTALNAAGKITGTVTRRNGNGVLAVNVVCRDVADGDNNIVSFLSGQNLDGNGEFLCGGLPAGNYEVEIEAVKHSINTFDPFPPLIPSELYSGTSESFDPDIDALASSVQIPVTLGNTIADIDVILNENGRLQSGVPITSTLTSQLPTYGWFVSVPSGATKATFTLTGATPSIDLDLYVRKDSEFSIAANADSIYSYSGSSSSQQALFGSIEDGGNEQIVIDSTTNPKLSQGDYHILLARFGSTSNATFDLQVDLEGTATLVVSNQSRNAVQSNGQTLVSSGRILSRGDTFVVSGIEFEDQGDGSMTAVTQAYVYEDVDGNGSIGNSDRLIAQASQITPSTRVISFTGLSEEVADGEEMPILISYQVTASSSLGGYGLSGYLLLLMFLSLLCAGKKQHRVLMVCMVLMLAGSSLHCGKKSGGPYDPRVSSKNAVNASALGFGDTFTFDDGRVDNVRDFFRF